MRASSTPVSVRPTSGGQSLIRSRFRSDAFLLAALAGGLHVWFLGLFLLRGFVYPVGPDAPVYLWWMRLAGADGLSAVPRPGAMALLGVTLGTGVGLPAAVAGVECALGVAIGAAAAALARTGGASRIGWALAGTLAGTFATHLVAGYVSNLIFAVVFVAALVVLDDASRRSVVAAAVLLGAGALAHPLFFLVGAAVLVLAGALAFAREREQTWRALAATIGGATVFGAGWVLLLAGPPVFRTDTSQDAFLRRAGLGDALAHAYRDRLIQRWWRYALSASVPLAAFGVTACRGWVRRALVAWFAVTVAGVAVGAVTAWFPPDRFITFGYAIPILAAAGVTAIVERWSRRRLMVAVAAALTLAMMAGAAIAWLREEPYLKPRAVDAVAVAVGAASGTPLGTPWIFPIDPPSTQMSLVATLLQNVIRATVPPGRIPDVHVIVPPPPPGLSADEEREWSAFADRSAADAARAARGRPAPVVFDIALFDSRHEARRPVCQPPVCRALDGPFTRVADGVSVSAAAIAGRTTGPPDQTLDSSTARVALGAPLVLAVLALVGFGWSSLVARDRPTAVALAPAFGTAAAVLGGVLADRAGLRLTGAGPGLLVLTLAGAGGYLALLAQRRRRAQPTSTLGR
ncbi:MAG TPA: hypothetical protein VF984_07575 [Actinomycetota bacterium]